MDAFALPSVMVCTASHITPRTASHSESAARRHHPPSRLRPFPFPTRDAYNALELGRGLTLYLALHKGIAAETANDALKTMHGRNMSKATRHKGYVDEP
jgi:hypothetical protein